jgi:hypothetical protein
MKCKSEKRFIQKYDTKKRGPDNIEKQVKG